LILTGHPISTSGSTPIGAYASGLSPPGSYPAEAE
jgi:hypothetical protein